jgi:hypothetical protein
MAKNSGIILGLAAGAAALWAVSRASGSSGGGSGGGGGSPGGNGPATITEQPQSITVQQGGTAFFQIVAGGRPPLSYEWFANGLAVGGNQDTLTFGPLQVTANGTEIVCYVLNDLGFDVSTPAIITVV